MVQRMAEGRKNFQEHRPLFMRQVSPRHKTFKSFDQKDPTIQEEMTARVSVSIPNIIGRIRAFRNPFDW